MFLVAVLLFVLVMMRYAGDPKNWAWMGFNTGPRETPTEEAGTSDFPSSAPLHLVPNRSLVGADDGMDSDAPTSSVMAESPELGRLRLDFWTRLLRRLDAPSRQALLAMVWGDERRGNNANDQFENLISRIGQFNQQYSTELLGQSAALDEADPARKQLWIDTLFQWQNEWSQQVAPTLKSLATVAGGQPNPTPAIDSLRDALSQAAAGLVRDDSPLGRPIEIFYWNLLVDRAARDDAMAPAAPKVSWTELRKQPNAFRGERVVIDGRIRAARRQTSAGAIQGIDRYYELWVQADETSTIPVCVYALELPPDFPEIGERLVELDLATSIEGYFFKNRSYLTSETKTQFCPVLLARRPKVTIAPVATIRTRSPSPYAFAGILAGAGALAAWIAFRVYRASIFSGRIPSSAISAALVDLEKDSRVETVGERLAKWEEQSGETGTLSKTKTNIGTSD